MGQIVGTSAKVKRCNLSAIQTGGSQYNTILANGEYMLVSSDNSMTTTGNGNFDSYILGDGTTPCGNLPIMSIVATDATLTENSTKPVQSGIVYTAIGDLRTDVFGADAINLDILDDVVKNNGYVSTAGKVTSYNNSYFYSNPILLKKGQSISVVASGSGVTFLSKAPTDSVSIGDTLEPLTGKSYTAEEDTYIVISAQTSTFTYAHITADAVEGAIGEILSTEKEAYIEEIALQYYTGGYIDPDTKTIVSYNNWKYTKPIVIKKGDFVVGNFTYFGIVDSEDIAVGSTLIDAGTADFFSTEEDSVLVTFSGNVEPIITIYHQASQSLVHNIDLLNARMFGGSVNNYINEIVPELEWIPGVYIAKNADNSEAVSQSTYSITKPIAMSEGDTIKLKVSGLNTCALAFVSGDGTQESPYVYTDIYGLDIKFDSYNQPYIIYTAVENCNVAVCSQTSYYTKVFLYKKAQVSFDSIDEEIKKLSSEDAILDIKSTSLTPEWKQYGELQYSRMRAFYQEHPNSAVPFFISTDMHGSGLEQHRWAHNIDVDGVNFASIMLGDNTIGNNSGTSELEALYDRTKDVKNFISVVGNHDVTKAETGVTFWAVSKNFITTYKHFKHAPIPLNCYVAYDDIRNVKYISISEYIEQYPDTQNTLPPSFIEWIIRELSIDDGYDIVILKHWYYHTFFKSRDGSEFATSGGVNGGTFELVKGRYAKTSGTFTYDDNQYSYDFTNCKTDLLCALHGHEHHEMYSYTVKPLMYAAKCFAHDSYGGDNYTHSCLFGIIDRDNRLLRIWMWHNDAAMEELDLPLDNE